MISVIVLYYNSRFDYFQEAIESVLSQSYTNWEVIIVNDGSNKENTNKLENYIKSLNDERFSIINLDKNYGEPVARNKGVEKAKGDIITFLDADDLHLPWYYSEIVNHFNKYPASLILASFEVYFLNFYRVRRFCFNPAHSYLLEDKKNAERFLDLVRNANCYFFPRMAHKKEVFKYVSYDPDLYTASDTDLYLQIINNDNLLNNMLVTPIIGYLYRLYPSETRLTHKLGLMFQNTEKMFNKYKDEGALAFKTIKYWKKDGHRFRFSTILSNYFTHGLLFKSLKEIHLSYTSLKEKARAVRTLLYEIFNSVFFSSILKIEGRFIKLLRKGENSELWRVADLFKEHTANCKDEKTLFYLNKIFEKIPLN